jgi:sugar fermentation stimulation protein A
MVRTAASTRAVSSRIKEAPSPGTGLPAADLEELAALSREGYSCHVLFVSVHSSPDTFLPNLHSDPAFAAALSRFGWTPDPAPPSPSEQTPSEQTPPEPGRVAIHAALLRCGQDGRAELANAHVPVDLSRGALAEQNSGSYLLLLEMPEGRDISVGSLGTRPFPRGWYVYAGSARKNLSQRLSRHLRKVRKQQHWHIDYLTPHAGKMKALPIMSYRNLECSLAGALAKLGGRPVPDFGSSDCRCGSHCYYFEDPPMGNRDFVDMLLRFRHVEGLLR